MADQTDAPAPTQSNTTEAEAAPAQPVTLEQDFSDINAMLIEGLKGEDAPQTEQAPETPAAKAEAGKPKEPEAPKDHVAALMSKSIRRDREASEKLAKANDLVKEVQAKSERFGSVEAALASKDYIKAIRALVPDVDPSVFLVEALDALEQNEAPITKEEMKRIAREEVIAEEKARIEAEKAAKEKATAEARAQTKQAFGEYLKECAAEAKNVEEYPLASRPGVLNRFRDDMYAYAMAYIDRTKEAPSVPAIMAKLEAELADLFAEPIRTSKKYAVQAPPKPAPRESFTLTPRITSDETGSPREARVLTLEEELAEINQAIMRADG